MDQTIKDKDLLRRHTEEVYPPDRMHRIRACDRRRPCISPSWHVGCPASLLPCVVVHVALLGLIDHEQWSRRSLRSALCASSCGRRSIDRRASSLVACCDDHRRVAPTCTRDDSTWPARATGVEDLEKQGRETSGRLRRLVCDLSHSLSGRAACRYIVRGRKAGHVRDGAVGWIY
jgi:hypothetical protein